MSALGPGCVKTRRRSIAIEQVTRSRPFHVPASEAHSILKSKSRISFSFRFELLSFHTAWVKTRRTQFEHMFSGLPSNSDIARCSRHVSNGPRGDIKSVFLNSD